jgi:hypothetical protein
MHGGGGGGDRRPIEAPLASAVLPLLAAGCVLKQTRLSRSPLAMPAAPRARRSGSTPTGTSAAMGASVLAGPAMVSSMLAGVRIAEVVVVVIAVVISDLRG